MTALDPAKARKSRTRRSSLLRLWPVGLLLAALIAALVFGVTPASLAEAISANHAAWLDWSGPRPLLAAAAFALFYALAVSISLPGALWFTIAAVFLLGAWTGFWVSLFGATVGAINIFLAARHAAGPRFLARFGSRTRRYARGLKRDGFAYIVILRMVPAPFFAVNVAAALAGVKLRDYALGTLIGAVPATVLYANIGDALSELAADSFALSLKDLARPEVLTAAGMAVLLAFAPLAWRRFKARRRASEPDGAADE